MFGNCAFSNRFNTEKSYYQTFYDEILVPEEVEYTYYKAAITKRNRWMVDHADLMLVYIDHDYGGTSQTYQYTQKNPQFLTQRKEYQDAQTNCH